MSEYTFREKGCHDLLDETMVIIFAELTRFRKGYDRKAEELATGQAEARTEMALKFKALGVDIDIIVQATVLDKETVESL